MSSIIPRIPTFKEDEDSRIDGLKLEIIFLKQRIEYLRKHNILLTTTIECPQCMHLIEKLPDQLDEVIWSGGEVVCDKCGKTIIIKLIVKDE